MGAPVCIVAGCHRRPAGTNRICARCWTLVPVETRLALSDHFSAYGDPASRGDLSLDDWRDFLRWSFRETESNAAVEAAAEYENRELERYRAKYEETRL